MGSEYQKRKHSRVSIDIKLKKLQKCIFFNTLSLFFKFLCFKGLTLSYRLTANCQKSAKIKSYIK